MTGELQRQIDAIAADHREVSRRTARRVMEALDRAGVGDLVRWYVQEEDRDQGEDGVEKAAGANLEPPPAKDEPRPTPGFVGTPRGALRFTGATKKKNTVTRTNTDRRRACLEAARWVKGTKTRVRVQARLADKLGVRPQDVGRIASNIERQWKLAGHGLRAGSPRKVDEVGVGKREMDCAAYKSCLNLVTERSWKGFSCEGCPGPGNLVLPPADER